MQTQTSATNQAPPSSPTLPKYVITQEDLHKMETMSEAQKKIYIMRKQVSVYREGALFNRRKLKNPDKTKAYVWVNSKEERRMAYEAFDWKVCRDPNVGSNYWREDDKLHRCADLILYEMPRELYEMMKADEVVRGLELTDQKNAESAFSSAIRQAGVHVPTFQPKV